MHILPRRFPVDPAQPSKFKATTRDRTTRKFYNAPQNNLEKYPCSKNSRDKDLSAQNIPVMQEFKL